MFWCPHSPSPPYERSCRSELGVKGEAAFGGRRSRPLTPISLIRQCCSYGGEGQSRSALGNTRKRQTCPGQRGGPGAGSPAGAPLSGGFLWCSKRKSPPVIRRGSTSRRWLGGKLALLGQWHERTAELVGRRRPWHESGTRRKGQPADQRTLPDLPSGASPLDGGLFRAQRSRQLEFARGAESLLASLPLGLSFWSQALGVVPIGFTRTGPSRDQVPPRIEGAGWTSNGGHRLAQPALPVSPAALDLF